MPVCFLHIYTHSTITCMRTAKVILCMGIYLKTASSLSLQCYKMHSQHACNTISPYGNPHAGKSGNGLILDKCKSVPLTFLQWSLQCPGWVLHRAQYYSNIKYKIRPRSTLIYIYYISIPLLLHILTGSSRIKTHYLTASHFWELITVLFHL